MSEILAIDWHAVFWPSLGIAEVVVRGSIMYLAMFVILRIMARRQAGNFGPADLLVIVLIADAAQNGLGKDYNSVTEGVVLVLTIVAWEYLIDWLSWRFPALRPILTAPPLKLIANGRVDHAALRAEMISVDELMGQLREKDVFTLDGVSEAFLEGDGRLSVKTRSKS